MLNEYLQQVRRFVNDPNEQLLNEHDLISYINRARREIALRTQSIRVLTPIYGAVDSVMVTSGGTGYSANPTITFSTPDAPPGNATDPMGASAVATATVVSGVITAISVQYGGDGYFQPTITITDATGTGATAVAITSPTNITQNGQEIYNFSDVDLTRFPGVASIFFVKSVNILYANYRYSLANYGFSAYQAFIRQYPNLYYYVPVVASQYGQGTNGSMYLYPIASQPYQLEFDCFCLPQDLISNASVEALPAPWTDAVPWKAAELAYAELQNLNASAYYAKRFEDYIHMYSGAARPGRATNIYGRV